jgi:diguanylate cyclase (GGDEF)-like protein
LEQSIAGPRERAALARMAVAVRSEAWELADAAVDEAIRTGAVPRLAAAGPLARLGALPPVVAAIGRALVEPSAREDLVERLADHAGERAAASFSVEDVVAELLVLRRALVRFALDHEAPEAETALDAVVGGCVAAYVERLTGELAERARLDPLTGLLNHQAFTAALEHEVERARRYSRGLALIYLDVDEFKAINDTQGHPEGDRALRTVARLLRDGLRRSDLAARMGGDEFTVALLEADEEAAGRFVARLVDRVAELAAREQLPAGFSLSPGAAHFPTESPGAEALVRLADARLLEAKRVRRSVPAPEPPPDPPAAPS